MAKNPFFVKRKKSLKSQSQSFRISIIFHFHHFPARFQKRSKFPKVYLIFGPILTTFWTLTAQKWPKYRFLNFFKETYIVTHIDADILHFIVNFWKPIFGPGMVHFPKKVRNPVLPNLPPSCICTNFK